MNKIYKIVWSKAKHAYVVTSEVARSHSKEPHEKRFGKSGESRSGGSCGDGSPHGWLCG